MLIRAIILRKSWYSSILIHHWLRTKMPRIINANQSPVVHLIAGACINSSSIAKIPTDLLRLILSFLEPSEFRKIIFLSTAFLSLRNVPSLNVYPVPISYFPTVSFFNPAPKSFESPHSITTAAVNTLICAGGYVLVGGYSSGEIRMISQRTGKSGSCLKIPFNRVDGFVADKRFNILAVCSETFGIWIIDVSNWKVMRTITHIKAHQLALTPLGDKVIAAVGCSIRAWNTNTGRLITQFQQEHSDQWIYSLETSADGSLCSSGGRELMLWSLENYRLIHQWNHEGGYFLVSKFTADGQYLLAGDNKGVLRIYAVVTGACLLNLQTPLGAILDLIPTFLNGEPYIYILGSCKEACDNHWGGYTPEKAQKIIDSPVLYLYNMQGKLEYCKHICADVSLIKSINPGGLLNDPKIRKAVNLYPTKMAIESDKLYVGFKNNNGCSGGVFCYDIIKMIHLKEIPPQDQAKTNRIGV